ncbi:MAG: hypothetical protein U9N47_06340 [Thermodesulfobacteriota bacterium]|nr:hypothetical protein [Thermodesulfobacteriota bacterium]
MSMKKEDIIVSLGNLGYPILSKDKNILNKSEIIDVLDALVDLDEPRLIEGFPVILAYCAHRRSNLDFETLLLKYPKNSKKRRDLEILLLLSAEMLNLENLQLPSGLENIANSLKTKYGNLISSEAVDLEKGISLSIERLRNTLKRYASNLETQKSAKEKAADRQKKSFQLNLHLSTLFSPKQKELVLKKYNGEPLTKTEQEYYSRVVKKKIEALANSELRRITTALAKK